MHISNLIPQHQIVIDDYQNGVCVRERERERTIFNMVFLTSSLHSFAELTLS